MSLSHMSVDENAGISNDTEEKRVKLNMQIEQENGKLN
jgi:hypothetical protein